MEQRKKNKLKFYWDAVVVFMARGNSSSYEIRATASCVSTNYATVFFFNLKHFQFGKENKLFTSLLHVLKSDCL